MSIKEDIEKVENKMKEIENEGWAMSILNDYKKTNVRMFIIWIITFLALIGLLCYNIYLLNDIGTTTTTQEVSDIETIGGNVVNNGDVYGEN